MKKIYLILFLMASALSAQSFSIEADASVKTDSLDKDVVFHYNIINNTQDSLSLRLIRTYNDLPEFWTSSFCFDELCFPFFIDTVTTTSQFQSSPLGPGEQREISFHVFTNSTEGTGKIHFKIENFHNASDSIGFDLYVTTDFVYGNSGFEFIPVAMQQTDTLGSEIVFEGEYTNISDVPLILDFIRTENNLLPGWMSSMCFDVCFPPFTDSVSTTEMFASSPILPGESREFSFHFFTADSAGTSNAVLKIKNAYFPDDVSEFTFEATAEPITSLKSDLETIAGFYLNQNYPNPFNPSTIIDFGIEIDSQVNIEIFDLLGRKVVNLYSGYLKSGSHQILFDASKLSSGIYIYKLTAGNIVLSNKMMLEK